MKSANRRFARKSNFDNYLGVEVVGFESRIGSAFALDEVGTHRLRFELQPSVFVQRPATASGGSGGAAPPIGATVVVRSLKVESPRRDDV